MNLVDIRTAQQAAAKPDPERLQIERIWLLEKLNLGPVGYFSTLAMDDDEILAVGAANVLLDQNVVPEKIRDRIVALSGSQSIQLRAFDFFMGEYDYDRVQAVLDTPLRSSDELIKRQLVAKLSEDASQLIAIELERFHRTGEIAPIEAAARAAESAGGWKKALPLLVDLILVNPQDPEWALRLGRTLRNANRYDLIERFCEIVDKIQIFPNISLILRAMVALNQGEARQGLQLLDRVSPKHIPQSGPVTIVSLKAELMEHLGRFEEAYRSYCKQNKLMRGPGFDTSVFRDRTKAKAEAKIEDAGPDERTDHYLMLGFPRSGTTLLENALASHPEIETFEEISALGSLSQFFFTRSESGTNSFGRNFTLQARARYYREIDRHKNKPGAKVFIDKLPIASADAKFFEKVFPGKRYIFSIRHPYDVVLSCFKQAFTPNAAMDNFTTFADSCRVYDFVMNEWFGTFSLDSEDVCYVRYDRLVTDLKTEISRALSFVGLDWNEEILEFAQRAEERRVKTPSYAKVRSGLSLGVQSGWRNYEFLFRTADARPLDRWVKLFGYEGL